MCFTELRKARMLIKQKEKADVMMQINKKQMIVLHFCWLCGSSCASNSLSYIFC